MVSLAVTLKIASIITLVASVSEVEFIIVFSASADCVAFIIKLLLVEYHSITLPYLVFLNFVLLSAFEKSQDVVAVVYITKLLFVEDNLNTLPFKCSRTFGASQDSVAVVYTTGPLI